MRHYRQEITMDDRSTCDRIGPWSEIKLEIVRDYASAYSRILASQSKLSHVYIDAFAGAGLHVSKTTGEYVPGSPLNALLVEPKFAEYYFIDLDRHKVKSLKQIAAERPNVHVFEGDCNKVLVERIFPNVRYEDFRRGLCLLDPYGLHLEWKTIKAAADTRAIEFFLNFPTMDINRNVLWRNQEQVSAEQANRLTLFWGDDSWSEIAYKPSGLFPEYTEKVSNNDEIAQAFRQRLKSVAGFDYVPDPLPMRNTTGAVIYYLFFASHKAVAKKIVNDIFNKYRDRGIRRG